MQHQKIKLKFKKKNGHYKNQTKWPKTINLKKKQTKILKKKTARKIKPNNGYQGGKIKPNTNERKMWEHFKPKNCEKIVKKKYSGSIK